MHRRSMQTHNCSCMHPKAVATHPPRRSRPRFSAAPRAVYKEVESLPQDPSSPNPTSHLSCLHSHVFVFGSTSWTRTTHHHLFFSTLIDKLLRNQLTLRSRRKHRTSLTTSRALAHSSLTPLPRRPKTVGGTRTGPRHSRQSGCSRV